MGRLREERAQPTVGTLASDSRMRERLSGCQGLGGQFHAEGLRKVGLPGRPVLEMKDQRACEPPGVDGSQQGGKGGFWALIGRVQRGDEVLHD